MDFTLHLEPSVIVALCGVAAIWFAAMVFVGIKKRG